MAERIQIQCPHCSAKLAISDEAKLGTKIRCPKCSEPFVAKAVIPTEKKKSVSKPKVKKSDEDEFDLDGVEMEDASDLEEEESEAETRRMRPKSSRKKGAKGKGKPRASDSNLPAVIGVGVGVAFLLGVGGYFLFGRRERAPVVSNQQVASPSATAIAPSMIPTTAGASTAHAPASAHGSPGGSTVVASPSAATAPTVQQYLEGADAGPSAEVQATNSTDWPAGIKGISARTQWYRWGLTGIDASGNNAEVIELLIDVSGEIASKTCAFGQADATTVRAGDQTLTVFRPQTRTWYDPVHHLVPYNPGTKNGADTHPDGAVRFVIPITAPATSATKLDVVEGKLKIRIGQSVEDIVIPDVREVVTQRGKLPGALSAAGGSFFMVRQLTAQSKMQEWISFQIGPKNAVGPLVMVSTSNPLDRVNFDPDFEKDIDCRHFTTKAQFQLPKATLSMSFKLYSKIEDLAVPFRFENVPLPNPDKKPKK